MLTASIRLRVAAAAAVLIAGCTSQARQETGKPFTPDVEDFVSIYLKHGGDKLTNWVQTDKTRPAADTLRSFRTIEGLTVDLVASEPVIRQPVDLHFDDRGRLWVVQYLQYPFPAGLTITSYDQYLRARYSDAPAAPPGHVRGADKITVLEDTNGDGLFDAHQDVITGLNITTSVLTGHGGIWVMNPPYLLFYPDKTADGVPDGDPQVKLSGFGLEDTHSLANSLTWGPDGWLYGVHGSTSTGNVRGIAFRGQAVWRYHPDRDAFELFAQGGGNPWTLSFDSQGRAFSGDNGGNSRGFHWVTGGRYEKNWPKHGPFTRPYSYGFIPNMEHHGYAARFAMTSVVYEDGKLPGYEGQLIAGMALTSRVQASRLVADGSTFATVDTEALLTTNDRSFRPVDMAVGPDGAIYVADWCDIRMDHTDPRDTWDKSCGRIWRLRATAAPPVPRFDLASEPTARLVQLLGDERKWYRDHARRLLAERRDRTMLAQLQRTAREKRGQVALEALWTVNLIGGMDPQWASSLLNHPDASIRYWTLRLLTDHGSTPLGVEEQLIGLARSEPDPEVRSELANAAGHLQTRAALSVVRELIRRPEDLSDKHIPLRVWWTLEALIGRDADAVLTWLEEADVWRAPLFVGQLASRIAQRLAAERGDRPSFRRLDPDENWKLYALHPRSPMPDRKGDYTDWETNDTPEVSRRNLSRLTRLLDIAPADLQDRLLDGARAGLGAGPPAREMPPRLRTLLAAFEKKRDANAGAGDVKLERGRTDFLTYCAPCHQNDGSGMARLAKPLRNSAWVLGDERSLARIVLHGLKSELLMPPMGTLSDEQLALIATYIRSAWGHDAGPISPELIANVRAASRNRTTPWTTAELDALRLER